MEYLVHVSLNLNIVSSCSYCLKKTPMIWKGSYVNSPVLEIHMTTFQEMYACFEQNFLVLHSKLKQDAEEWLSL